MDDIDSIYELRMLIYDQIVDNLHAHEGGQNMFKLISDFHSPQKSIKSST